jgi:polar amino acid transport system permease protein
MVINVGAYSTEIVRAGIEAVHPSQIEAAESLGLSTFQIYRDIVLRPALERVYPALTSQFTLMMLMSSVTSQISVEELTGAANVIQSITFRSMETYLVVGLIYLLLTVLLKIGFWALGLVLFPRRRCLGTPL